MHDCPKLQMRAFPKLQKGGDLKRKDVRAEDGDLVVVAAVLGGELAALGRAVAEAADLALFRGSTRPAAVVNPH